MRTPSKWWCCCVGCQSVPRSCQVQLERSLANQLLSSSCPLTSPSTLPSSPWAARNSSSLVPSHPPTRPFPAPRPPACPTTDGEIHPPSIHPPGLIHTGFPPPIVASGETPHDGLSSGRRQDKTSVAAYLVCCQTLRYVRACHSSPPTCLQNLTLPALSLIPAHARTPAL